MTTPHTPPIEAHVESITPLTDSILQLVLHPTHYIDYEAGQYLQMQLDDERLSYSIANAPLGSRRYLLHIRHHRDNSYTQRLLARIKHHGSVMIQLPFGTCDLRHLHPEKPIIFIAGGTGFAPIHAMIEQLLASGDPRAFELFWGARSKSDLYMDEKVTHWQMHSQHFRYFSLISETSKQPLSALVLTHHHHDLNDWQIVISGPFDMVYATRDHLLAHGASMTNLFSDAFGFTPKETT